MRRATVMCVMGLIVLFSSSQAAAAAVLASPLAASAPPEQLPDQPLGPLDLAYRPLPEPVAIEPTADSISQLNAADRAFVREAATANLAEIALAKLALKKATQAEVRAFAQRLINTHIAAQSQLRMLVEARNIVLPTALHGETQAHKAILEKTSGLQFDRDYVQIEIRRHGALGELLRSEMVSGDDKWLRDWATRLQRLVQSNGQQAHDLDNTLRIGV